MKTIEKVKQRVKELLEQSTIHGFLGLKAWEGHISPFLFTQIEELENVSLGDLERPGDCRYPLNRIVLTLCRRYPKAVFGVLVRGCDERGLKALFSWNQLDPGKIIPVGFSCPQELADACECQSPFPSDPIDSPQASSVQSVTVQELDSWSHEERFHFWESFFSRCIKCFGCRNICPMCFCQQCTLENHDVIPSELYPPSFPLFHLIRAMHMAGRCIDCGLCEQACPVNIPLRRLYKKINVIIGQEFGFQPGVTEECKSPLHTCVPNADDNT
jgi:ferredoxin